MRCSPVSYTHLREKLFALSRLWLALACVLISSFSLNEYNKYAHRNVLEGCWKKICEIGGSDAQMAFYYYLLFLWHHLTGAESERCV